MRLIRYLHNSEKARYGWVLDGKVGELIGSPFGEYSREEPDLDLEKVTLLPPTEPSKIICVGKNYAAHAEEHDSEVPEAPLLFLKPPSTLIATQQEIVLPPQSQQVEHEAELAVVIGKRGRWIQLEDYADHVYGYTIANDVTARDLQRRDAQWTRGKGFDTFCPLGPWVETKIDPTDALISCHVGEELRQMASSRDLVFTVPQLIVYASSVMTLEPGDILLTGTPAGVGPLEPGDQVTVTIEGIGELSNSVVADPQR